MGRKGKISALEKQDAVQEYLSEKRCISQICRDMGVDRHSFYKWLQKYQMFGVEGLTTVGKNKYYPATIKQQAVREYLAGKKSQDEICRQYEISSHSILQQWIKKYNGHETFKSHDFKGDKSMTKGRKTTFEERVEIVAFCIADGNNYQKTADKFQVSYQQVYTWVKKYEEHGSEALSDRRGKHKSLEEMNESEKLAAHLKLLEAENSKLKMENDYLKKLDEVERRRSGKGHVVKTNI
ncbi:IS2 repressor TnpA [Ruminiclostridium hungatei]|uniref:IS2 repressor TnpA n=1 Tax=Ruminiclostridium hungatei TaxID=48256 RepID=A0A1V4SG78_RUMHU|nr:helix-turn-helix domain-containing protein [Ruminiclostridium hungatei]OPX42860.1 IS2 repressor TnpA [Ruminiclostridium hungatei]